MRDLLKFLICLNQNLILLHLNLKVEEKKSLATLPPISPSEQQFVGVESPDAPPQPRNEEKQFTENTNPTYKGCCCTAARKFIFRLL